VRSARFRSDEGASAVEYGLVVVAIAAVCAVVVYALGGITHELFQSSTTCIENHDATSCA
jgi:pilus assembly protein Flp/PilA